MSCVQSCYCCPENCSTTPGDQLQVVGVVSTLPYVNTQPCSGTPSAKHGPVGWLIAAARHTIQAVCHSQLLTTLLSSMDRCESHFCFLPAGLPHAMLKFISCTFCTCQLSAYDASSGSSSCRSGCCSTCRQGHCNALLKRKTW